MERTGEESGFGPVQYPRHTRIAVLALSYVALWIGLWFGSSALNLATGVSLWYPPAGLTFAILLEYGRWALPLPVLASLIAGLSLWSWEQWPYYLAANLVSPLGYLVVARALKNHSRAVCHDKWRFNDPQRVAAFLGAAALGALFAALTGAWILQVAGLLRPTESWLKVVLGWWVGDFIGVATVAPLALIFAAAPVRRFYEGEPFHFNRSWSWADLRPTRLTWFQLVLSVQLLVALFWAPRHFWPDQPYPFMTLLLLPVLTWIVTACDMRGTALTVSLYELGIVAMVVLFGPTDVAFQYQVVMATVVASGLLTGAVSHARLADLARFRDLAEVANDLLWEFDASGRLRDLGGHSVKVIGSRNTSLGVSWRSYVIPQEQDTDLVVLKAAIRRRRSFQQLVLRVRLPDQERSIWTSNSGLPLFDEDGEFIGYRGTTTDITEQKKVEALEKKTEALMRDYDRTLESRVEAKVVERTRVLAEVSQRNWKLANFDSLTGLPNRNLLFAHLRKGLQQARRQWRLLAILLVDLDGFKQVNDTFGHDMGDELLRQVAERLQKCIRAADIAARLGGDEFTIILPDLESPNAAAIVARKIITSLAEPVPLGEASATVTASVGVSFYRPELPASLELAMALLREADTAMYAAKKAGKNTWRFADQLGLE